LFGGSKKFKIKSLELKPKVKIKLEAIYWRVFGTTLLSSKMKSLHGLCGVSLLGQRAIP
jgi:hypothetical protein